MAIQIVKTDITTLDVDVIVNAANSALKGGGGVDGAIHAAAGPELAVEASKYAPLETGGVVTTAGYKLKAKNVIHTVGPIWKDGEQSEHILLARCYKNALAEADKLGARSIAFPAISTGVYGFPCAEAAFVAMITVMNLEKLYPDLEINMVCFDEQMYETYKAVSVILDAKTKPLL